MTLHADQLFNDPEIQRAIDTILSRVKEHQGLITQSESAKKDQSSHFSRLRDAMAQYKGALYYPYLSSGLGNGAYVECADGSVKLDFISGIGVHWSHGDLDVMRKSLLASIHDTVMQGNLQQHQGTVELYELLVQCSGMDHGFLTSSGVMGVENALKLGFQYKQEAQRVLAFSNCFCGRTLAAASITDKPQYRVGLPQVLPVDYVPFYDATSPQKSIEEAEKQLLTYIHRYPGQHAAMVFELIQGEGGFNVGSRPFFRRLMSILREHDIPVYVDETQTFGRTTRCFAFQMFGLEDLVDIVSIGKLAQVCATLYKKKFKPKPGLISQTYTSSTVAIESSKVIINKLLHENYFGKTGKIAKMHGYFARQFRKLAERYPDKLFGFNGVGSMISFVPLKGEREKVLALSHRLFEKGLICFIAGNNPTKLRFLLPIGAVTFDDIDHSLAILEEGIKEDESSD